MMPMHLARKMRASLIGISTDGDHRLDFIVEEKIHVLGVMTRRADSDFFEDTNGERMNVTGRI
jgi:hypothetical protein